MASLASPPSLLVLQARLYLSGVLCTVQITVAEKGALKQGFTSKTNFEIHLVQMH